MKTMLLTTLTFLILGMVSCKNDSSTNINTPEDALRTMTAKEIVESGISINVTMHELEDMERETVTRNGQEECPLWAIPAYRAAHYRFVTHAKQDEKGILTWTAKCGADLNMSDDLFNFFANDFKENNEFIQMNINKGIKCTPIWINEEYLNNILSDEFITKRLKELKELKHQIESGEFIVLNKK